MTITWSARLWVFAYYRFFLPLNMIGWDLFHLPLTGLLRHISESPISIVPEQEVGSILIVAKHIREGMTYNGPHHDTSPSCTHRQDSAVECWKEEQPRYSERERCRMGEASERRTAIRLHNKSERQEIIADFPGHFLWVGRLFLLTQPLTLMGCTQKDTWAHTCWQSFASTTI